MLNNQYIYIIDKKLSDLKCEKTDDYIVFQHEMYNYLQSFSIHNEKKSLGIYEKLKAIDFLLEFKYPEIFLLTNSEFYLFSEDEKKLVEHYFKSDTKDNKFIIIYSDDKKGMIKNDFFFINSVIVISTNSINKYYLFLRDDSRMKDILTMIYHLINDFLEL